MDIIPFYKKNNIKVYLFIMPPFGVNTYLIISKKSLIIVDPGKGSKEFFDSLNLFNINNFDYKGIIITHTHYDHIVGVKEFEGFRIMVPEKDKEGIIDESKNLSYLFGENFNMNIKFATIYEGYYNFGDLKFLASYYPGHTPGSMIYDFGEFIFTGDFIFCDSIGRTDLPYGDEEAMFESLKNFNEYIKSKKDSTIIMPGHMEVCTLKELKDTNIFLKYGGKK
ncbi:Glyoxylase, beta-lactamase superfamily II [Marinitoga hydrogenitolerans DSM 16785]|uniref:Glyoxylase, beta-lactamase superfamily II n=1 Tax=Marinitoga hydrogenitolerans (strain DSM 16785 / JCM 12826 / AT1271) TaxID=1122195 RepID=A0A1M4T0U4_MARH1|nr:MBL fold metallo-hydrolase [Marinitoga hydrogenitolerans]SHE38045.1 Glyoxylase, beta-lactamase superfamily II [Marinitoga hydrogenitolerans DSM 16785]